jgi:ribosomal protein S18 acetylase RimI-like enzyme
MKTRRLTSADYDQIVELWQKAGLPYKPQGRDRREAFEAQVVTNPDLCIGVFEENRLAGVVLATSDGRKGWINRLAVDSDCRRRGVAKTLIHEAETALRKRGIQVFCALIESGNAASMRLFKASGYREHRDIVYFSKRGSGQV